MTEKYRIFERENFCPPGAGIRKRSCGTGGLPLMALLCALVLLWATAAMPCRVLAAEESGDSSGLEIEVVGEYSIDDEIIIEDQEVPLALPEEKPAENGTRHAAMMGLVFCCAAGYVLYFHRYEERLFGLRREAARAQKQAMDGSRRT
jgi:hypothetical protein